MISRWTARFAGSFCTAGLLLGTLFFAASLTPSLLDNGDGTLRRV